MGIGASILLLAVGAILAFAVKSTTVWGVDVHVVGYILMAAGGVGLIWSLIVMSMSRRRIVNVSDESDPAVVIHKPAVREEGEYHPGGF